MKTKLLFAAGILGCVGLYAAGIPDVSPEVVSEYMDKPIQDWQLNLTSLLVASMFGMRVLNYLKNNGGIKSLGKAIWCGGLGGENVPTEVSRKVKPTGGNPLR
jgi:hypothetical protein